MKIICAILLMLASLPVFATNPLRSDIAGKVVDDNQLPIANAIVTITDLRTNDVMVKHTNAKGRYVALNLRADGIYQVSVSSEGREIVFVPGPVVLGHQVRRNAVLGELAQSDTPPAFMQSWQWNQAKYLQ